MNAEDILTDLRARATQGTWFRNHYGDLSARQHCGDVIRPFHNYRDKAMPATVDHVAVLHNLEPAIIEVIRAARLDVTCLYGEGTHYQIYRADPCDVCPPCKRRGALQSLDAQAAEMAGGVK